MNILCSYLKPVEKQFPFQLCSIFHRELNEFLCLYSKNLLNSRVCEDTSAVRASVVREIEEAVVFNLK